MLASWRNLSSEFALSRLAQPIDHGDQELASFGFGLFCRGAHRIERLDHQRERVRSALAL